MGVTEFQRPVRPVVLAALSADSVPDVPVAPVGTGGCRHGQRDEAYQPRAPVAGPPAETPAAPSPI
ncbi:hypothetical protein BBK14_26950 [Parafrankia soli]|uniref:Uncharacterized protein n=1 Tax=Parafrankia soli TaxID=2599596 RepID=A0A1S1PJ52_9ACTN|nr:hypothetical protein BBK14_26950 [Parafrankia soli]